MGNTNCRFSSRTSPLVHPHMRGEYVFITIIMLILIGSPPHAWGILILPVQLAGIKRFTPTCVGNTSHHTIDIKSCRFTPTCVGNTGVLVIVQRLEAVHPHMRGEYNGLHLIKFCGCGSPPHAWGIRGYLQVIESTLRFTPTCVGNTGAYVSDEFGGAVHPHMRGEYVRVTGLASVLTVHPHMRGEYLNVPKASVHYSGSPPHAWGIP